MWEQEPVNVRISLLGPGLSSSTGHGESQFVVMLFKQAGTWWFVFCLIYYKITQDIFNTASESILGNPQKRAESSNPKQPGYIWLNFALLSLGRKFSNSASCEDKDADIDLGSDRRAPAEHEHCEPMGFFIVRGKRKRSYPPMALRAQDSNHNGDAKGKVTVLGICC